MGTWGAAEWALILATIIGIIATAFGYLLSGRHKSNESAIAILFKKHDEDVSELSNLKIEIAKKHYEREDINAMFGKIEKTVSDGFIMLGAKFDTLSTKMEIISDKLATHIGHEKGREET